MPTSCRFVLARKSPVYYSGEQVSGSVQFRTGKKLPLEAITLTLLGHCRVEWSERSRVLLVEHNDCTKAEALLESYSGVQECHRESLLLHDNTTLPPGTYSHEFCFTLPEQCPATVCERYGEVAYEVRLALCRPSAHNKVYKQSILIRNRRDLKEDAAHNGICTAVLPALRGDGGGSKLQVSLPVAGFVPGQVLRYRVDVLGGIDVLGSQVLVELCQRLVFTACEPVKRNKEVLKTIASTMAPLSCRGTFDGALVIPLNIAISSMNRECLIQISYHLSAVRVVGRIIEGEAEVLPLIIGTIPQQSCRFLGAGGAYCYDNLAAAEAGRYLQNKEKVENEIYRAVLQSDIELSPKGGHSDRPALLKKYQDRNIAETYC